MPRVLRFRCLVFLFTAGAGLANAGPPSEASPMCPHPPGRPAIGLVLSGGGARGLAHVGVLRVLEELRVPIDCIAGTSVGAVVGGLYASGMSPRDIETRLRSLDWQDAFRDRPSRRDLAFRRKQDDRNFLVRLPLGLRSGRVLLPRGLIQGQKLQQIMRTLTVPVMDRASFNDLPTPFRAVATNLETGARVLLERGDLAAAMRSSMSAPGVFAPVELDHALLVDGGLSENLPVDVAHSMGADVLIVVDVSFQLQARSELDTALAVSNQMLAILVRHDTERQKAALSTRDVLVEPALGDTSSTDFTSAAHAIDTGRAAAEQLRPRLAQLSVSDDEYLRYAALRSSRAVNRPQVNFVSINPVSARYGPTITAAMKPLVGKPLDPVALESAFTELYGLDNFESLDYSIVENAAHETGLEVHARRKSWGPNYVRFGLNLQDDFQGDSNYNAAVRFIVTELNALGGEWLTDLQIGENPKAVTEFYQPLTYERRWFIAPSARAEVRNLDLYSGDTRIAEYRVRETEEDLDVGRNLSNWGETRIGVHFRSGAARLRLGEPLLPTTPFQSGEMFFKFSYDRLDNVDFPRQGQTFSVQWDADRTGLASDINSDRVRADWLIAGSRGRNTLISWTTAGTTLDGRTASRIQDLYSLGGFFNLSGLPVQSQFGPHYAISRLIGFRKIGHGGESFLDFPAYLGASLEIGNTWAHRGDLSLGSAHKDGALFLGLDTFLGPLYLGAGYDSQGFSAFYLFLGRTF